VEVENTAQVTEAITRLTDEGLATDVETNTTCCYAVQDKVWVNGPGRERWEIYTVLADAHSDLEGKTTGNLDCDQTACSCEAPRPRPRTARSSHSSPRAGAADSTRVRPQAHATGVSAENDPLWKTTDR
jgi:hypothetical protein